MPRYLTLLYLHSAALYSAPNRYVSLKMTAMQDKICSSAFTFIGFSDVGISSIFSLLSFILRSSYLCSYLMTTGVSKRGSASEDLNNC